MASFRSHQGATGLCLIVVVLGLCTRAPAVEFAGGTGEPNNPYQIATAEQLDALSRQPELWGEHFVLIDDIDLAGRSYPNALLGQDNNSTHGFDGTVFTGVFDGRGHAIAGLVAVSDGEFMGLFGRIGPGASVRNLGVTDVRVRGRVHRIIRECGTGGLAGENGGEILNCYTTGSVSGTLEVGGLVGHNEGLILDCFTLAGVTGESQTGGLVGVNATGVVSNCYAAGLVTGLWATGDLVGDNRGSVGNCYYLGSEDAAGPGDGVRRALTVAQMSQQASFQGWDFLGQRSDGTREIWTMPIDGGYPALSVFYGYKPVELPGGGTPTDPYLIETAEHLGAVYARPWACYRLAIDLDLAGITWSAAPISGLWGTLDGAGHTISHLSMAPAGWAGLVGVIQFGAKAANLELGQVTISGLSYSQRMGALAGVNRGKVTSCFALAAVSGAGNLGGLVGWNEGLITLCFTDCSVEGSSLGIGGLVGYNAQGEIDSCYAMGHATGGDYLGGLVGWNLSIVDASYSGAAVGSGARGAGGLAGMNNSQGTIRTCYAYGSVAGAGANVGGLVGSNAGRVIGGLWDRQASAQVRSAGGAGFTTAQMKTAEPYALNGWAADPNWVLDEGHDYPRLAWEGAPGRPIPEPQIDWFEGSGTEGDPYQIATPEQLCRVADAGVLWDKRFVLTQDLDLTSIDYQPIGMGIVWPFSGVLDGKEHVIRGLTIHRTGSSTACIGLFGGIDTNALICNLSIRNVSIVCERGSYVGTLVGRSLGTLRDCSVDGSVTIMGKGQFIGGLVGANGGTLQGCQAALTLSSGAESEQIGGLAGSHRGVSCADCSSTGSVAVTRAWYTGGLIGYSTGEVLRCWTDTSATATGGSSLIGGLVGYSIAPIAYCCAKGAMAADADALRVGGLVGGNNSTVTDCYASGPVQGGESLGGLIGYNWYSAEVKRCWASGQVIGRQDAEQVGGLVGYGGDVGANCYRLDPNSGGGPDNRYGTPLTWEQMEQQASFADWDFETVWSICEDRDYPRLRWEQVECE